MKDLTVTIEFHARVSDKQAALLESAANSSTLKQNIRPEDLVVWDAKGKAEPLSFDFVQVINLHSKPAS
jgi:hypothetical protein